MFDIGFWEVSIVAIVALLLVGPERLPKLARLLGQWMVRFRRIWDKTLDEVTKTSDSQDKPNK